MNDVDKTINLLGQFLEKKVKREEAEERARKWQKPKDILLYLGIAGACLFIPNAVRIFQPLVKTEKIPSWFSFDKRYLKRTLARLQKQKEIKIARKNGQTIVSVTDLGRKKLIKLSLEELEIKKPKEWDGRWRLVIYDIPGKKRKTANLIREHLLTLGFYSLQESVYIHPYPCRDQVEILRGYYNLGEELLYMVICEIDYEDVLTRYFDLT